MLYIFSSSIADKTLLSRLWENLLICHVVELCNLIGPTLPRNVQEYAGIEFTSIPASRCVACQCVM